MAGSGGTGAEQAGRVRTAADGDLDTAWMVDVLDNAADLFVVVDESTVIRWISSSIRRIGGFDPAEVVGRSMAEFVHPDDLLRAADVQRMAATGFFNADHPTRPTVYRLRHADGSWRPMEVTASTARSEGGTLLLVIRENGDPVSLRNLLEAASSNAPFEQQLTCVLELMCWRYPDFGHAVYFRDDRGELRVCSIGIDDPRLLNTDVQALTPWARALRHREVVPCPDLADRSLVSAELHDAARAEGFVSCLASPVGADVDDDAACYVAWTNVEAPAIDGSAVSGLLTVLAAQETDGLRALRLTLQLHHQQRSLERSARLDALTGLMSRARYFEVAGDRLARSALLYVDVDGFKHVNDLNGHAAGDKVLVEIARRIATEAGPQAIVTRLGGDEFVVHCPPGTDESAAVRLADAIVKSAANPILIDGLPVDVAVSVGVAVHHPDESVDDLVERADGALLEVKGAGKNGWRVASYPMVSSRSVEQRVRRQARHTSD